MGAGGYIFRKYVSPLTGKPAPKEAIDESLMMLKKSLKLMEDYWLKNENQKYLLGDELSLPDLSCAAEITQITASNIAPLIDKYPKVKKWFNRMLEIPEFKEVHDKAYGMLSKGFKLVDEAEEEKPKL